MEDIVDPEITVSAKGEIAIPDAPGRGYEVKRELVERLQRFHSYRIPKPLRRSGFFIKKKPP